MKVMLACGGTGGHIFPAFSVAEALKAQNPPCEIFYVCGKKDIENAIFKIVAGEKIISVDSAPFRGTLSLWDPVFLIKLASGFMRSVQAVREEKPDLVIGFGGYFSFPVVLAARFLGRKTMVHEQNAVLGKANRWLAPWVDGVALSFSETLRFLPNRGRRRVTGNPIRSSIERDCRDEALTYFNFSPEKVTVLVLGGSQGSESINTLFLKSLSFLPEEWKAKLQVLHLCGRMAPETAAADFKKSGVGAHVYSFFERMDLAYGAADLAVGRAGATFLAEIGSKNIPAILIPYPYGNGHQRVNAEVFGRDRPDTVVLEQQGLTAEILACSLTALLGRAAELRKRRAQSEAGLNARTALADFILEVARS
jgi:UDP-N-acetylglucosamine--N-acetylmuramyl-(pentapeptide) pyrophosphoryl-undecaprenol N-acetylglucosamine transferase